MLVHIGVHDLFRGYHLGDEEEHFSKCNGGQPSPRLVCSRRTKVTAVQTEAGLDQLPWRLPTGKPSDVLIV